MPRGIYKKRTLRERFNAKWRLCPKTGCWLWTANTGAKWGYGAIAATRVVFGVPGPQLAAHRVSWELHRGPIPDGLFVLHECDVPACVNPAHLFLGTVQDNSDDMVAKGRSLPGESNPFARLTSANALAIYFDLRGIQAIADEHGVSYTTIRNVLTGKSWSTVTGIPSTDTKRHR